MTSQIWRIESRRFVLPKEGAANDECEDAVGVNDEARAYAVADGATEAFDARRWAARLAGEWVRAASPPVTTEEFRAWVAAEGERLHQSWDGPPLPWYAEEKRGAGSFAAFVGVRFETASRRALRWRAVAVGDSCLVQLRCGSVLAALPLTGAEQFNSCPPLVPSAAGLRETALARAVYAAGEAAPGDCFLLLSDAIAAWFFATRARGGDVLEEFDSLAAASENEALTELLRRERGAGRLRDDDVAVVRVSIGGA